MRIARYLFLLTIIILICADSSFAEITKRSAKGIVEAFNANSTIISSSLTVYALRIFYWCLILEVAFLGIKVALNRAAMEETIKQFLMLLLFAGFCWAVIIHWNDWTDKIIKGLGRYANAATGVNLTLSPLDVGFDIFNKILIIIKGISWHEVATILIYFICGTIILICLAMITARIIIIKCEAYIAMTASIILLGFGGSSFFKEYAINTMRYAFSVAFKLFVMQILMGVGMGFIDQLMIPAAAEYQDLFVVIACVVILLVLVNTIPEVAAGIINGSHIGAGVGMRAAVTGAMAAVGGAVGAAAGTVAAPTRLAGSVSDAAKIASLEGHSGAGAFGATVGNLWKGHSAARQSKNTMGSLNQRMSSHLKDRKATAKAASSVEDPWKEMMHAQDGGSKSKK